MLVLDLFHILSREDFGKRTSILNLLYVNKLVKKKQNNLEPTVYPSP